MEPFRVIEFESEGDHRFAFALIGPDLGIWSRSWARCDLDRRAKLYNEIYEFGYLAGRGQD